jgi:hypothetical protein
MPIERIRGRIRYEPQARAAFLQENGPEGGFVSLLAMDVPPLGHIQANDISAAFNHLKVFLRVADGQDIVLLGFHDRFANQPLVLIVRIGEEDIA